MTPGDREAAPPARGPGSRVWTSVFRVLFAMAPARPVRAIRRVVPFGPVEEIVIVGRRSGQERRFMLSLLEVEGNWYVAHPNGLRAHWVKNLLAAGYAVVVRRDGTTTRVKAIPLPDGPERDGAIRATSRLQPFPANLVYFGGRRHMQAAGQVFRLERESGPGAS